jgi:DNA repair exonuclease SbcCD ATPase subunit
MRNPTKNVRERYEGFDTVTFRLQRVSIEGFRAYGSRVEFDCDGEVIALVGSNGWGKTSFFDAITWCLFGQIPRLTGTRDFVGEELIRNRFVPEVEPYVSVGLANGPESVVIARDSHGLRVATDTGELVSLAAEDWVATLIQGDPLPESVRLGAGPDSGGEVSLDFPDDPESMFLRCYYLGQDQMTAFLRESSPRVRFDALASLLGFDVVRAFHRHMSVVRRELSDELEGLRRQQRSLEQRNGSLRAEIDAIESADDGLSPTFEMLSDEFSLLLASAGPLAEGRISDQRVVSTTDLVERTRDLSTFFGELANSQESRSAEIARLRADVHQVAQEAESAELLVASRESAETDASRLRAVIATFEGQAQEVADRRSTIEAELGEADQRRQDLVGFLTLANLHLTSDKCPLCEQSIDLAAVKETVAARLRALPDELVALQAEKGDADRRSQELERQLTSARGELRRAEEGIAAVNQQLSVRSASIENLRTRLGTLQLRLEAKGLDDALALEATAASNMARAAADLLPQARVLAQRTATLAEGGKLAGLQGQMDALQESLSNTTAEVEELSSSIELATRIVMATRRSERGLVRSMFESIEPTLDLLYGRLRPHPVLDRIRLDVGSYDERGEVRFVAYSGATEANVNTIFSSAQLNAVAVCVFLAMSLAVGRSHVSFALLDDPIQNMDDFNVLGLLDLLRGLVGDRQFVVSTHDDQIGELVRRKLRPQEPARRTIVHKFLSYKGDGPIVETEIDEYVASPNIMDQAVG